MIPIYKPWITNLELEYVNKAVASGWISHYGDYIEEFKDHLKRITKYKYIVLTTTGTAACHTLLHSYGISGKIAVPALTYAASIHAITYCRATPIIIDVDDNNWMLGGDRPRSFPTYLYGSMIKKHYEIVDAAEAFGEKGNALGAAYSLFANKTITTGQGGFVGTDDEGLAIEASKFIKHYHRGNYYHTGIGQNYAMTNVQAAMGSAQCVRYQEIKERKEAIYDKYCHAFRDTFKLQEDNSHKWMFGMRVNKMPQMASYLHEHGIETRPSFVPLHLLPAFRDDISRPIAEQIAKELILLPSFPELTDIEQNYIIERILEFKKEKDQ